MRIVDQPSSFSLTVNADVKADDTNRLRIRGDKLAGTVQAFDVVMLGEDIGLYVPMQKALYHGKVAELRNFSFYFSPDEVLRQLLSPDTSLLLKDWQEIPAPRGMAAELVLEEVTPANRPHQIIAINRRNGMLVRVSHLDSRGEVILEKTYGDYRVSGSGRRTRNEGKVFPFLMGMNWPRENRSMEIHFKALEENAVILDEDFDLATSGDTQYFPLQEVNIEADLPANSVSVAPQFPGAADSRLL
jgi:hypothetical protein